ncbi:MAG: tail fiber domain-containing protein [Prolixibacteraceae bacterium]
MKNFLKIQNQSINQSINQSKKLFLIALILIASFDAFAQISVNSNGDVGIGRLNYYGKLDVANGARIGNITSQYHSGRYGIYGEAITYDFNTNVSNGGLIMEQGNSESAGLYVDGDYAVIWSPGDGGSNPAGTTGYLLKVIDEDGMVLKWYLDGSGVAYTNSDKNRKENIKEVNESKDKLKQLKAVKYNFKKEDLTNPQNKDVGVKFDPSQKEYYGFLAQDVEKLYPELVDTDENGDKYVSYMQFIPILLSAINEQSELIQENNNEIISLDQKLTKLENQIDDLQTALAKTQQKSATIDQNSSEVFEAATLSQNIPNPFSVNTTINMYLPSTVNKAILYIYTMQGEQIQKLTINERGNTAANIEGHSLKAGMYLYTLIADGKEVDTKKMILTK